MTIPVSASKGTGRKDHGSFEPQENRRLQHRSVYHYPSFSPQPPNLFPEFNRVPYILFHAWKTSFLGRQFQLGAWDKGVQTSALRLEQVREFCAAPTTGQPSARLANIWDLHQTTTHTPALKLRPPPNPHPTPPTPTQPNPTNKPAPHPNPDP